MKNERVEVLLRFYEEHATQARQHESQRERFTTIFLLVCAAVVGFIANQLEEPIAQLSAVFLMVWGIVGCLISLFHYRLSRFHWMVVKWARRAIDSTQGVGGYPGLSESSLSALQKRAEEDCPRYLPRLRKLSLHGAWALVPLFVSTIGAIALIYLIDRAGFLLW